MLQYITEWNAVINASFGAKLKVYNIWRFGEVWVEQWE